MRYIVTEMMKYDKRRLTWNGCISTPPNIRPSKWNGWTIIGGYTSVIKKRIKAMMHVEKRPSVNRLKGRVIRVNMGFKILNPIARSSPPIISVPSPPCTLNPSKSKDVV